MVKSTSFFRCAHLRGDVILCRWPWLSACVQGFASPFASKASRHDYAITGPRGKLSAPKVSWNHGNASVSESGHDAPGDAKISVHDIDVKVAFDTSNVETLARSPDKAKFCFAGGDAKVLGPAASVRHGKAHSSSGDASEALSCEAQSPHALLLTLFKQTERKADITRTDLRQKVMLLESEQFSLSDARRLLKKKAFKSCSPQQLATMLQELRRFFISAELAHDIMVKSSNVLLQPPELVQKKLKLLRDFQVEEKVVSKLCGSGGVLSVSMEDLQKRLVFYDKIGLTVEARNMMFWRAPLILSLSLENSILPPLKFLESKGLSKASILKVAQLWPEVFYMSLESLMRKYECLSQLGFSGENFSRAFRISSRSNVNKIEEHLNTLRVCGFTDEDARSMIQMQPGLLGLACKNLKCKIDFLIGKQQRNLSEIARYPSCLVYSLQARMIPRFNVINDLGRSKVYSLSSILCPPDSKFRKQFGKAIDSRDGSCVHLETCCSKA